MSKVRVPLWQQPGKFVVLDTAGREPATVGVNVFLPDGSLFNPASLGQAPARPAGPPSVGGITVTVWGALQNVPPNIKAIESLASAANQLPYFTGAGTAALTPITGFARTLLDDASAGDARNTLGLGTAATQPISAFEPAGAVAAHAAAADPHPQYLTPAEGNAAYAPISHTHAASQISDSTVAGRAMVTAADAAAQRTLLNVADGATANATDAALRDRATHTGTQLAATISDFATAVSSNAAVVANTAKVTNATHTGEVTGATALTIANDVVTNAKLANVATATIKGRITAAVGDPEDLTAAQARTVLNVADGATANATDAALRDRATHTGTQPHTTITGLGTAATQPISAFEPAGAVAAHAAAADPHPQYTTLAEIALVDRTFITDSRGASRAPNFYDGRFAQWDFQNNSDTQAGGDTWHGLLTVHPWTVHDVSHRQQQLAFTGTGGLRFRYATSETTWDAWQTVWTSGNSAQVQAGTTTGHVATWNHVSGRYEASALGTAALANIGTSGATVPLLNGANTWSAVQVFGGAAGSEGGEFWLQAPATFTNLTGNVVVDIQGNNFRVFGLYSGQTRGFRFNFDGGTPGGINALWHDGNFNPGNYGTLAGNNTWSGSQNSTGYFSFDVNNDSNLPIATASGGVGAFQALGTGTGAAFMSFHRPNLYAVHFGLDTDNRLKVGGGSMGAVAHEIWHSGNQASVAAGTTTGQLARWNNTAGRYEPVTLNTLTDAADDAAAATAGVAVGGLYRTGSILKTRIA